MDVFDVVEEGAPVCLVGCPFEDSIGCEVGVRVVVGFASVECEAFGPGVEDVVEAFFGFYAFCA